MQCESDVHLLLDLVKQTLLEKYVKGDWVCTDAEFKVLEPMWEAFRQGKIQFEGCRYANVKSLLPTPSIATLVLMPLLHRC